MAISQIKASSIFADTITAADIAADAVGASELGNLSVDTAAIQNFAVSDGKVDATVATRAKAVVLPMIFGTYQ